MFVRKSKYKELLSKLNYLKKQQAKNRHPSAPKMTTTKRKVVKEL
jgi:hypothetical protein